MCGGFGCRTFYFRGIAIADISNLSIDERVVKFRKAEGINQTEMGKYLGIKTTTYSQKERNGKFDGEALKIIAEVLDIDVKILLYGELKTEENLYQEIYNKIQAEFEKKYSFIDFIPKKDLRLIRTLCCMTTKKRLAVFQYMMDIFTKKIKI